MKNFGKTTDIRDIITVGYEADNAVLYSTSQSLTNDQKIQARANIGAGTSNFDGDYKSLANKPTIPKKTSQLENDSNFATTSQVEAKYTKPKGGIPKTDLATAVQNSLTAADNAVKYTSQSLTDAQKDQARKNIGAGTSSFSGNYKDLAGKPDIPPEVSIVQSTGESTSSVMSQKATTNAVNGRLSKTDNTNIEVLGTKKATTTLGGNQLYAPNGVIFGGTAAAAGLVTSGICGVSTPSDGGACSKENLYINYDGNNDFNVNRQVVLNAGTVGNHLGSNMYQYTVPRGEIVKNWVEAKGYATSVKVNGNTIASSNGVVDIGTVLTDASKFATAAQGTKADNAMPKSGGTFTGEVKFGSTENFQGYYIKRMIGSLGPGTRYADLDSSYKDGTWHRMWRLRFPKDSSFWGKIKITLYGGYSSFNASGVMSKSITCNFNTSNIYNNVGCYDGLGVNVEQDFRISEAIWNATVSAWEVLIWQKNLNGNNSPTIMLECWTTNSTGYINAFNGIAAQTVELTQSTSYSAQRASSTGGTKTVEWATLPVYENPLGEEIATVAMLEDKQDKITSCEAISLANADWEMSGGYNIVPKKPLVDGYEGVLCFNLEVIPHPLEISWDNATAWGDIPNAVGVRLFSFTYEGETQDICFVEFPAGTEINNTVLTFSAYAIWLGTIIPLWADTEFWKAYGDGGSGGAISANGNGWVKNDGLPVYGNYMRYIVAVSITNIANQDIWGGYITGEQLWTKKPASEFSWSEIYPYYYSATKTLSSTPMAGSEVALLCDSVAEADIRLCESCGVTIGKVDGANITFYAMDKPYKNLALFVEYAK